MIRAILYNACLRYAHLFFQKGMLVFDAAQFDGILKKISEFNSSLQSDSVNKLKF